MLEEKNTIKNMSAFRRRVKIEDGREKERKGILLAGKTLKNQQGYESDLKKARWGLFLNREGKRHKSPS